MIFRNHFIHTPHRRPDNAGMMISTSHPVLCGSRRRANSESCPPWGARCPCYGGNFMTAKGGKPATFPAVRRHFPAPASPARWTLNRRPHDAGIMIFTNSPGGTDAARRGPGTKTAKGRGEGSDCPDFVPNADAANNSRREAAFPRAGTVRPDGPSTRRDDG